MLQHFTGRNNFFKKWKIVQIDRNGFKRRKRLSSIFCRRWRSRGFYKYAERGPPSLTCKWAKKETSSPEWNVSVTSASFSVFIFQTGQIFDGNKWTWRIIFERIFFLFIPFDRSFNALTKVIWLRVDPSWNSVCKFAAKMTRDGVSWTLTSVFVRLRSRTSSNHFGPKRRFIEHFKGSRLV